jgi:hypothetical protein
MIVGMPEEVKALPLQVVFAQRNRQIFAPCPLIAQHQSYQDTTAEQHTQETDKGYNTNQRGECAKDQTGNNNTEQRQRQQTPPENTSVVVAADTL